MTTQSKKRLSRELRLFMGLLIGFVALSCVSIVVLTVLILRKAPPPVVRLDPAGAAKFEAQMRETRHTAGQSAPQTLRIDEGALNSFLVSHLPPEPDPTDKHNKDSDDDETATVRDVRMSLSGDMVHFYFVLGIRKRDVSVEMTGKLKTQNGYFEFLPSGGRIGALPIPQSAIEKLFERVMNSPEGRNALLRLPRNVKELHVEGGQLIMTYK